MNESYDLACEYVAKKIHDAMGDRDVLPGETIAVDRLETCDCIPIAITDKHRCHWWLVRAMIWPPGNTQNRLRATYRRG